MNFSFFIFSVSPDQWPGAENRCKERTMPSGEKPASVCTTSQYSPWLYIAYHLPRDDLCSRYNMRYPFPFFLIHPIFNIPFSFTCLHYVLNLTSVLRTRLSEPLGITTPFVKKVHFSTSSLSHNGACPSLPAVSYAWAQFWGGTALYCLAPHQCVLLFL